LGEKELAKRGEKGLKYYLIRTSKLFGPQGESDLAKPSFFDTMIKLGREKEELKVVDSEKSCFTYTPDLAKATGEIIDSNLGFGIYHLINNGPATWYEAAQELFSLLRSSPRIIPVSSDEFPRPARRPEYSILLNNKFRSLRDWRQALKEYLDNKNN
jgi:dTDP-4-dehydrorhamnose reductase